MQKNFQKTALLLTLTAWLWSGCARAETPTPAANDLLQNVLSNGKLIVATDAEYPPQSELVANGTRAAQTKCAANEYTAQEFRGFDVEVAVEIAKRLGVEACFVAPPWAQIIGGGWDGRWDISVGSMAPTPDRLQTLYFTQPYYVTPAAFFVRQDSALTSLEELSGKRLGVCAGCTYEDYLNKRLKIPGVSPNYFIKDAPITGYDTDPAALEDLSKGGTDAVLTAQPTGLQSIENGLALRQLGEPVFFEYLAAATDQKSKQDSLSLAARVSEIIRAMHGDGTLIKFSQAFYGEDYTQAAEKFDLKLLEQIP